MHSQIFLTWENLKEIKTVYKGEPHKNLAATLLFLWKGARSSRFCFSKNIYVTNYEWKWKSLLCSIQNSSLKFLWLVHKSEFFEYQKHQNGDSYSAFTAPLKWYVLSCLTLFSNLIYILMQNICYSSKQWSIE